MMNMIQLNSHDRWYEIADYDVDTRSITRVYRPEVEAYRVPTSGDFGTVGDERLIVRTHGSAEIVVGFEYGREISLRDADIEWEHLGGTRARFLLSFRDYRHEISYDFGEYVPPDGWDVYGAEIEDYDFGRWVLAIKDSPERQDLILQQSSSSLSANPDAVPTGQEVSGVQVGGTARVKSAPGEETPGAHGPSSAPPNQNIGQHQEQRNDANG